MCAIKLTSWCLYCYLWRYFTDCSVVSIVAFEQINAGWGDSLSWPNNYLWYSMHKKWSFPLKISSANVSKCTVSCGCGHIYCRNPFTQYFWITHIQVSKKKKELNRLFSLERTSILKTSKHSIWALQMKRLGALQAPKRRPTGEASKIFSILTF